MIQNHSTIRLNKLELLLKHGFANRNVWQKIVQSELEILKNMQQNGRLTNQEIVQIDNISNQVMSM